MSTYESLITDFAWRGPEDKQKWIDNLAIENLKTLRDGIRNRGGSYVPKYTTVVSWYQYIDVALSKKIEEERDRKINDLGI